MGIAHREQRPGDPEAQRDAERAHEIGGSLQDLNLGISQGLGRLFENSAHAGGRRAALLSLSA